MREISQSLRTYLIAEKEAGVKEYFFDTPLSDTSDKKDMLARLRLETQGCRKCPLAKTRTKAVFGEGDPDAKLVFVGEAPGYDEDMRGEPFVGRAGQLLTKIIEAMRLKREDVYICNILKCRPAQNREPLPQEVDACKPYLLKQLDIIKPKVICCLGRHALFSLAGHQAQGSITAVRGQIFDFNGIKLIPTFHPAYLLRNPDDKKLVWEDMKKVLKLLKAS